METALARSLEEKADDPATALFWDGDNRPWIGACSFWPYTIPFALTVEQAASPGESLTFMFWGAGLFVMPLTLAYTFVVYRLFQGQVAEAGCE
ncbi:cytochrome d ubiquinol oxidase subunit II [Bradyrhizobium ganzhouense]|uniref:cytochrome d ubiquinol oxidase subunit II n=1 Tax=Bradyrhizobium ganzhouense TaxID=1179767 RepID=UPI003CEE6454